MIAVALGGLSDLFGTLTTLGLALSLS